MRMCTGSVLFAIGALVTVLAQGRTEEPGREAVDALLAGKRVSVDFVSQPLPEVIQEFQRQTGIACALDPKVLPSPEDQRFTAKLHEVSARRFLEVLCHDLDLGTEVAGDRTLVVTTAAELAKRRELRLFDIRDTIQASGWHGTVPGFRRPSPPTIGSVFDANAAVSGTTICTFFGLLNMIKEHIAKGTWDADDTSLIYFDGLLLAKHRPEVIAEIAQVVQAIQGSRIRPIILSWGIVDLPESCIPTTAARSTAGPRIVPAGAEAQAWQAALAVPSATWVVRRHLPIQPGCAPEQGGVRVPAGPEPSEGSWAMLQVNASPYRLEDRDRVKLEIALDSSQLANGANARETRQLVSGMDLGDGELAVFPLGGAQVMRLLVVQVAMMPPAAGSAEKVQPRVEDPSLAVLRSSLARHITLDLPSADLDGHLEALRQKTGLNIHLAGKSRDAGIAVSRFPMSVHDLPVEVALTQVAGACNLRWRVTPELIELDSADALEAVGPVSILEVRDFFGRSPSARPPGLVRNMSCAGATSEFARLTLAHSDGDGSYPWQNESLLSLTAESIQDLLRQYVSPSSWEERAEEVSMGTDEFGNLWVKHTPSVISEIRRYIERLREARPHEIALEYRLWSVPVGDIPVVPPSDDAAAAWWSPAVGRELLDGGGLISERDGSVFNAAVIQAGPLDPERGLVVAASLGAPTATGRMALWLRFDWAEVRPSGPATDPAGQMTSQTAGFDGAVELQQGETLLLTLGELSGGRSLVAAVRWRPTR